MKAFNNTLINPDNLPKEFEAIIERSNNPHGAWSMTIIAPFGDNDDAGSSGEIVGEFFYDSFEEADEDIDTLYNMGFSIQH